MTNDLPIPNISLADFIEDSLKKHSKSPAYSALGQTLSFAEIERKSRALAVWLQQYSGLNAGDRVIIQLPNLIQYPIAAYAILRAGMIIVNTNPLYTNREMLHQFNDSSAKAIIILSDLVPKLDAIIDETQIEQVIVTSAADLLTNDISYRHDSYKGLNKILQLDTPFILKPRSKSSADDVCVLQYTGGTTGVSKGACLSNKNIISAATQVITCLGSHIKPTEEVLACPLPLYHIYAFTVNIAAFFSQGNLSILIPNPKDLDAFVDALSPYKITGIAGINTLFVSLCQHDKFTALDFSALKTTISGGSTLTSTAMDIWKSTTGCTITEGYGLSESAGIVCINQPGNEHLGTVGPPTLGTEIQLWDKNNQQVSDDQSGEIAVRGPQIFKGYWNMPKESDDTISKHGFFKTGDIGIRLSDGCIKIIDRLKDMIIVSGFNVYPNEIEEVLTSHESIIEAAVIGEADEKTGEKVCAYITVNEPAMYDKANIIKFCRENLTAYKIPKKITLMQQLPKSTVGKILRRELRN